MRLVATDLLICKARRACLSVSVGRCLLAVQERTYYSAPVCRALGTVYITAIACS